MQTVWYLCIDSIYTHLGDLVMWYQVSYQTTEFCADTANAVVNTVN